MRVVQGGIIIWTAIVKDAPTDNTKINLRILATLALLALQVEEVRLETTVMTTDILASAPYVSLEDIRTSVLA